MNPTLAGFIGTWEMEDGDSSAVVKISERDEQPNVEVVDRSDGEILEVTNVCFDGTFLSFETRVPSSQYQTRNRLRLNADGSIQEELTLLERLVRTDI